MKQIADNGLQDDVLLHDRFIPDDDVKYYFSVADFLVQPYRRPHFGVTQIAYQFDLPMVVTDVGGLPEIVPDGRVGFVCRPDAAEVARAIDRIWRDDVLAGFRANMEEEKKRFSWDAMCDRITEPDWLNRKRRGSIRLNRNSCISKSGISYDPRRFSR